MVSLKRLARAAVCVALVGLFGSLLVSGLGWGERSAAAATVIRFGHLQQTNHPFHAAALEMAKLTADRSKGQLDVRVFPAGQLGDEKAEIEQVKLGSLQMFLASYGALGQWSPQMTVFEAPYAFKDLAHYRKMEKSRLYKDAVEKLAREFGMRIIGSWYLGTRQLVTRNFPVRKPEDLNGKKLRVPDNALYIELAKALGGSPTPFAYAEVYLGLQQGVLDATENPIPSMYSFKYQEVAKFLILTNHMIQNLPIIINEGFYQKLSPSDRAALGEAVAEVGNKVGEEILTNERRLRDTFKSLGVTVIEPDVQAFADRAMKMLPKQFEDKWGKGVFEEIRAMAE